MTKTEVVVLIACIAGAVGLGMCVLSVGLLLPALGKARQSARQMKDATQTRAIVQSMVVWAGQNNGEFPTPSRFDAEDNTIAGAAFPEQKDDTGNILSLLIYIGAINTGICISPAESNPGQVVEDVRYEFSDPAAAAVPADALWDPAFAGTPIDGRGGRAVMGVGNQSYAHSIPLGARKAMWADTFSPTHAVLGNRGPAYQGTTHPAGGRWMLAPGPTGDGSNTLLIHGGRRTWEGNIAYADASVRFETLPAPENVMYMRAGARTPDNLFVDETDDDSGTDWLTRTNNYLRPIAAVKGKAEAMEMVVWID